jgi:hypothetical protein
MLERRVPYAVLVTIKTNPTKLGAKVVILVNTRIRQIKQVANLIAMPVLTSILRKRPVPNVALVNIKIKPDVKTVNQENTTPNQDKSQQDV